MIGRRDFIIGGACIAAAAGAEVLRPHKRVTLLDEKQRLDPAIPKAFGKWKARDSEGIVAPQSEDSLAAKLYNQSVSRMYEDPDGNVVMLLIAYGNTQSDTLQLHRPEVCYPAFGFEITENMPAQIPIGHGATVPGRNLVASVPGRDERITYWTRVGEYLPVSNSEQREMRFKTSLAGIIPDGVLVRISNMLTEDGPAFALNGQFATELLAAVPPSVRPALVTTGKARALA
ncbi:MAG: EpsI family protein [Proteobacteria bacterium]|nr:EpsI family protein [Pseudomonadota bacterium]